MADKVHPPPPHQNGTTATTTVPPPPSSHTNGSFPAPRTQQYGATRPPPNYRPQQQPNHHHYRRRSRCCSFCLWLFLIIVVLLFAAAIAGAVLYLIYKPHRPTFAIESLRISRFNLTTSSSSLDSNLNLTLSTRNPNGKIVFIYNPISISITPSSIKSVNIGTGTFPSFTHGKKNTTVLRSLILNNGGKLEDADFTKLKSELKSKSGVPLTIELNTKVKVKIGSLNTKRVGIRVICDGIKAVTPTGNTSAVASTSKAECKVDLRFKIWKWTV